ncbi:MAG: portal protein [Gemmatimonadales bacterium]|nr:MAG: portal protein [Gemmatimonadales bacterium]
MVESSLLQDLGLMLVAAAVCVLAARPARIPSIVAYILTGLLLGPILGLVTVSDAVHLVSEVGIALLLFLVGLELSLEKIRDVGKVAVYAGLGQVIFTAGGGFGLCMLLGFGVLESVFIATALTFSSTVVVVKLLDQKKELDTVYGRIAVGIFLVQDLVVIVALTLLSGLGRGEEADAMQLLGQVGLAFAGMAVLLVAAWAATRWVLPRGFQWISRRPEALLIWALSWCFFLVLGAETLRISVEIGAFLAGISLAQLPYHGDLRRRVHPLMNFFIAIFFVSLGVQMEFQAAAAQWLPAIVLSLFVLIGNPLIFLLIITRMGYRRETAFLTSVTVAQISEFSFVLAALGLSAGVIGEEILSLIAVVGLVTIAVSAYMILYNHQLFAWLDRTPILRFLEPNGADAESGKEVEVEVREGHIIIVGMNALGRELARTLHERGSEVLAIDTDPVKLEGLPCPTLFGNAEYQSVLEEAGLERAELLISALHIEDVNRLLAYRAREAGVRAVIHAGDQVMERELERLGVALAVNSRAAGIERIISELQRSQAFRP